MYSVSCKFEMNGREYHTLPKLSRQFYSKLEALYYATELQDELNVRKATKVYIVVDELVNNEWHTIYVLRGENRL